MTAVLSEISDFDYYLNIVISDLWVICKYEYCILKWFLVDLKDLCEVWGSVKVLSKIENFYDRGP